MAYWGIAYAGGPNYNKSWHMLTPDDIESSFAKINGALVQANAPSVERALITALIARYPNSVVGNSDNLAHFDYRYAEVMHSVYEAYGEDLDVTALFADAVMCTRSRQLWDTNIGETTSKDVDDVRLAL
ncbi:hypothetical protein G6011_01236 [Alternaria panax]|uniref:Uncharacterized protein n=1 Tax=Alternaria panax TaxID=48097 RepID=A0AAD4IKF8_9PLEO|nr:hypothetical protein G6011_01236 [Alternaria panax]